MPLHTNTFVGSGSARPELTPCAKSKRTWIYRKCTYLQVTQKKRLLKCWKRAEASLRSFTRVTSFDPGLTDPR